MERKKPRASKESARPAPQPVIVCAWRRTDWQQRAWLSDIFLNGSPAGLLRVAAQLRQLVPAGRGELAVSCTHPGLAEYQAIFEASDHRTQKSEKRKNQLLAPDETFRQSGAKVAWLKGIDFKYSRTEEAPGAQLRGERAFVRLDETSLEDVASACAEQAQGWGNDGVFGRFTSVGLVFAPDWLGVE